MKRKKIMLLSFTFLLLAGTTVILVAGAMVRHAARGRTYADASEIPRRDVGLVLGCSRKLSNGRDNLFFQNRIAAAAALYKSEKVGVLIVSGDNRKATYDEPTDMKNALVAAGVPAEKIYCDYAGFRTLDSVVRARHVFGQDSLTIVSQRFHNQRAIYIARKHGIDAIGFDAAEVAFRHSFKTKCREQFSRVVAVLDILIGKRPKFLGEPVIIAREGDE
jgi:SanA protein